MTHKALLFFCGLLLSSACTGCSNVTVLRLTSETFPPRAVEDVAILSQEPTTEHIRIAELSETSSSRVGTLQRDILKKAAQLGADAVVFSAPHTRSEQRVDYQPMYNPWDSMLRITPPITMALVPMGIRGLSAMPTVEDGDLTGAINSMPPSPTQCASRR